MSEPTLNPDSKHVTVLFSGGRDSSLAACLFALKKYTVHLVSCKGGLGVRGDISEYRLRELKERFPQNIVYGGCLPIFGLVRKIAILNIEHDFARYKVNLVLVGAKLAMHAAATAYCLQQGIHVLADGTSGYQSHFPEQMPSALECLREFEAEYGIQYDNPVLQYKSEDDVKYTLLELGISTKSLEGVSIFSESFSTPTPDILVAYMREKLPLCRDHVHLLTTGDRLNV